MKKIRIDYYHYRLRKGRVSILLEYNSGTDEYAIPFEYVKKESRIQELARTCQIEDDGDLVLIADTLTDSRVSLKGKEWVSFDKLGEINVRGNESLRISHRIFRYFFPLCPREGESGAIRRVTDMLESVKVDIARKDYKDMLRRALDGELPAFSAPQFRFRTRLRSSRSWRLWSIFVLSNPIAFP